MSIAARADNPAGFMVEATVQGVQLEGPLLSWSDERVWLLVRDGRLWDFSPQEATNFRKTGFSFVPYSAPPDPAPPR